MRYPQVRASFIHENQRLADFDASRTADERLKQAPDDDNMPEVTLNEAMEDVEVVARGLGDEDLVSRELKPFDELADTADAYGKAVRAAASCRLRRGV